MSDIKASALRDNAIRFLTARRIGSEHTIYLVRRWASRSGETEIHQAFYVDDSRELEPIGIYLAHALRLEYESVKHGGGIVFRRRAGHTPAWHLAHLAAALGIDDTVNEFQVEWL